jgi:hypothetical protein
MNELGRNGWIEYQVNYPKADAKPEGMTIERARTFQERHGYMPSSQALVSTRWFRRLVG